MEFPKMKNLCIKKEPLEYELSFIEVKEEKNGEIGEIDQSKNIKTEIALKNSEEKQVNSFEIKKEPEDKKDEIDQSNDVFTVFPYVVAAATILFWRLGCGKYSREETIQRRKLLISWFFVSIHTYLLLMIK